MNLKVIEHSTRKISFTIDELIPLTEQDEQLINIYIKLHDHEQYIQNTGKILLKETKVLNEEIEEVRKNLDIVANQINELSSFADSFIIPDPNKEVKSKQILDKADKVSKTIAAYQDLLLKLEKSLEKFCEIKSEYLDKLEDFTLWETFDFVNLQHSQNYKINAIDIVSFGDEEELFRNYVSVHTERNNSIYDMADKSIENYNALMLETKIQYATWAELSKRMHLIRAIVENSGDTFISLAN